MTFWDYPGDCWGRLWLSRGLSGHFLLATRVAKSEAHSSLGGGRGGGGGGGEGGGGVGRLLVRPSVRRLAVAGLR